MEKHLIVMLYDKKSADLFVDFENKTVRYINYETHRFGGIFKKKTPPTWNDFIKFLESRCVCKERVGLNSILASLGLFSYDPWEYVKRTRGVVLRDHRWLRFTEADDITYDRIVSEDFPLTPDRANELLGEYQDE